MATADALEQIIAAFRADNAGDVRRLLDAYPEFRSKVNEPTGPFESPAIVNVRSRAMLDVLLDAGADINAKSTWWAGGFGLLDSAEPDLAHYAIERGATVTAHSAARLGMLDKLKELVTGDSTSVHARGGDGQFPLHFASTIPIADFLLDNGADIDGRDIDHVSTAAQWMTENRHEIARFLISRGCQTDILMATAVGDLELVRKILDADPDAIRMRVSDEYFPLIGPKKGGSIYQWMLGWYVSAHQVARKFNRTAILQLLLERSPPAVKLLDSCWMADEPAVLALLAENPGIRDALSTGELRHMAHAARNNELLVVRLMLECGFPVDGTSQHQATALHWAAFHGNAEMIRLLLMHNPPLEVRDADFDGTPLRWAIYGSEHSWRAAEGDYPSSVRALIDAGARLPDAIGGTRSVRQVLREHDLKEDE